MARKHQFSMYCPAIILLTFFAAAHSWADTLLLCKWDDPDSLDATYSLRGEVAFKEDLRFRDHPISKDSPDGRPHTKTKGKWGGGLSCLDADNAKTNGNGNKVSQVCGGWYSMKQNFNLDEGTIEFWFKPNWEPGPSEPVHMLFTTGNHIGDGTGAQDYIYVMWYWLADGHGCLQGGWINAGAATPIFVGEYKLRAGEFSKGTWHHLALSWNNKEGRFFVDGKRATKNDVQNLNLREETEGADFILGGRDTSVHIYPAGDPANGTYDNLRVSDTMLYDPNSDFTVPGDFEIPQLGAVKLIDLGFGQTMEFLLVPAGKFNIISKQGKSIQLEIAKPFYLGKYEVTQAQWTAIMGTNPSTYQDPQSPVNNVSWNDCQQFIGKLRQKTGKTNLRLPTEAEWEYACRGGSSGKYSFGNSADQLPDHSWFSLNSAGAGKPVGQKQANPWGLHDMHGNVAEHCYDPFIGDLSRLDPKLPVGRGSGAELGHGLRGGSYQDGAKCLEAAFRKNLPEHQKSRAAGFRCILATELWASPARSPIVKPAIVWGDAGGGEMYAQAENSWPAIKHAVELGLTGIEIDMRPTADGHIVLWHEPDIHAGFYLVGGGKPNKTMLNEMTLAEVKALRYRATVAGREEELKLVLADELMTKYRDQLNFYLDIKTVPFDMFMDLINRYDLADKAIVGSFSMDQLRKVKQANPRISVELAAGMLGDRAVLTKAVAFLKSIGGESLASDGWRHDMVVYCHQNGICTRIFGGYVRFTDGSKFLMMGVDGLNGDNPEALLAAVDRLWGKEYMPKKGQTLRQVFDGRKRR